MSKKATELIADFLAAKQAESDAKEKRVAIGAELANLLGYPQEGSKTYTVDGTKITIKGVMNRRVDWDAFDALDLPAPPPVKTSRAIDVAGLEWYAEHHPNTYEQILQTITTTPGTTQVSIKEPKK